MDSQPDLFRSCLICGGGILTLGKGCDGRLNFPSWDGHCNDVDETTLLISNQTPATVWLECGLVRYIHVINEEQLTIPELGRRCSGAREDTRYSPLAAGSQGLRKLNKKVNMLILH